MSDTGLTWWVEERAAEGWTPEQVYLRLLQDGWTVAAIRDATVAADRTQRGADLRSRVVKIVVGVGVALIAAGVFSFVAANWQVMPSWLRVSIIIAATIVFSVTGYWLRERRGMRFTGAALVLLGSIVFGAGIFLVAQIYNLSGNWPDGFVMWSIGAIAMGAATRLKVLYLLGFAVGAIAAVGYPISLTDKYAVDAFVLTPAWLLFAGALAAIAGALLLRGELPAPWKDRW
jgi:uncharacterized membrane protein